MGIKRKVMNNNHTMSQKLSGHTTSDKVVTHHTLEPSLFATYANIIIKDSALRKCVSDVGKRVILPRIVEPWIGAPIIAVLTVEKKDISEGIVQWLWIRKWNNNTEEC